MIGRRRTWMVAALALAAASCAGILGLRQLSGPHPFEHRAHVLKGVACRTCHAGVDRAGERSPTHLPGTAACVTCHQKPHDPSECSACHGMPAARESAADARAHLKFRHDLHVPRLRGDCVRCHVDVKGDGLRLVPTMATCLGGCHAHEDQFVTRECDACHEDLKSEHQRPESHLVHDGDFLREHGARAASAGDLCASCHRETFCASCHGRTVPALRERLAFDSPQEAGIHRAGFRSRHAEEARADPGLCATCHSEDTCASCHTDRGISASAMGAVSPHPAGWLGLPGQRNDHGRAAWRDPVECASCHGGAGEALCIGCHQVGGIGGNPHAAGWTSTLDPRTDLPCRLCHQVGP